MILYNISEKYNLFVVHKGVQDVGFDLDMMQICQVTDEEHETALLMLVNQTLTNKSYSWNSFLFFTSSKTTNAWPNVAHGYVKSSWVLTE